MKNNLDHSHKRFYIFRHVPTLDPIQYFHASGMWVDNIEGADVWADYDFVLKTAYELNAIHQAKDFTKVFVVVIGSVVVDIDPHFAGVAI